MLSPATRFQRELTHSFARLRYVKKTALIKTKLFASAYALFSGLVFISVTGLMLAPVAHRALHGFHLDNNDHEPS